MKQSFEPRIKWNMASKPGPSKTEQRSKCKFADIFRTFIAYTCVNVVWMHRIESTRGSNVATDVGLTKGRFLMPRDSKMVEVDVQFELVWHIVTNGGVREAL
jgi:hypothetical protein